MKKLITLLLAAALVVPASAQLQKRNRFNHNNVEQYYGLRLGLNIASMSSDLSNFDTDSRTGLAFGAVYGLQLANNTPLWLEFGAMYSEKGGENTSFVTTDKDTNKEVMQKVTMRLSYLEVPVVVKYAFDVADDFYVQPFLGGYLAMGIGGKTKYYNDRTSDSSFDNFNRFDGGLRVGCGAEYQMVYAEVGFDFGLANISDDDFNSTRTRNFFINVGVNF